MSKKNKLIDIIVGQEKNKQVELVYTIGIKSSNPEEMLAIADILNDMKYHDMANKVYAKAADAGSGDACVKIAKAYLLGLGTDVSAKQAYNYFAQAAKTGDAHADLMMAAMAYYGIGTKPDVTMADKFMGKVVPDSSIVNEQVAESIGNADESTEDNTNIELSNADKSTEDNTNIELGNADEHTEDIMNIE